MSKSASKPATPPDDPNQNSQKPARSWRVKESPGFASWLAECDVSLAVTTYQAGKLLLLGRSPQGELTIGERSFQRAMGLWTNGQSLWLATAYQLWQLENQLDHRRRSSGFDRLFVPRIAYTTGDLDLHDVAIDSADQPVFVATQFNCLATVSPTESFEPVWQPPFISTIAAEDRCHLNGLAMKDGAAKYVTLCAPTDEKKAWKSRRMGSGQLLDVPTGEVVTQGLSMPHSPRWHNNRLWLLNSGAGFLGYVDLDSGKFEPVAFCPGYARGLAFVDRYAIVGLSKPREQNRFGGLALDDELAKRSQSSLTGLMVVDLESGETVHTLTIEGHIAELYDVAVLAGVTRPAALGLKSAPLRYNVWADGRHWRSPSADK